MCPATAEGWHNKSPHRKGLGSRGLLPLNMWATTKPGAHTAHHTMILVMTPQLDTGPHAVLKLTKLSFVAPPWTALAYASATCTCHHPAALTGVEEDNPHHASLCVTLCTQWQCTPTSTGPLRPCGPQAPYQPLPRIHGLPYFRFLFHNAWCNIPVSRCTCTMCCGRIYPPRKMHFQQGPHLNAWHEQL